tara:strand:+ start:52 stop:561 length:510 start_codon:yes stop_codon:yes gene_type:complete
MGFDIYGINPSKEEIPNANYSYELESGIYFRNNVWDWHPLWDLVINLCGDVLEPQDARYGHSNDHWVINKSKSLTIARRLEDRIDDGFVDKYIQDRRNELDKLPDIDCQVCGGTGYRREVPLAGPGELECNGCNTTGKKRPYECNYGLSKKNVEDFATFCRNSGGFSIG